MFDLNLRLVSERAFATHGSIDTKKGSQINKDAEESCSRFAKTAISGKGWDCPERLNVSSADWEEFKKLVSYHELCPFFYPLTKDCEGLFPGEMGEVFKNTYFYSLLRNQILLREFSRVSSAFQQAKARVVPIKGAAFLQDIYPVPSRFMEDIDLLAEETNLRAAGEVLAGLGYLERLDGLSREYWLNKQCHLQFIKPGAGKLDIGIDLHFSLDFKRGGRNILPRLWGRLNGSLLSAKIPFFACAPPRRGSLFALKNVIDAGLNLKNTSYWIGVICLKSKNPGGWLERFFCWTGKIVFGGEIPCGFELLCPSIIKEIAVLFYQA
jgi:hypothetical protein